MIPSMFFTIALPLFFISLLVSVIYMVVSVQKLHKHINMRDSEQLSVVASECSSGSAIAIACRLIRFSFLKEHKGEPRTVLLTAAVQRGVLYVVSYTIATIVICIMSYRLS